MISRLASLSKFCCVDIQKHFTPVVEILDEGVPGKTRIDSVGRVALVVPRRMGSTFLSSALALSEVFRLSLLGDPQEAFRCRRSDILNVVYITDKDKQGSARSTIAQLLHCAMTMCGREGLYIPVPMKQDNPFRFVFLTPRGTRIDLLIVSTQPSEIRGLNTVSAFLDSNRGYPLEPVLDCVMPIYNMFRLPRSTRPFGVLSIIHNSRNFTGEELALLRSRDFTTMILPRPL